MLFSIVRTKKDAQMEPRVEDSLSRLQSLFEAEMISKSQWRIILRLNYFYKESDYREEIDVRKK